MKFLKFFRKMKKVKNFQWEIIWFSIEFFWLFSNFEKFSKFSIFHFYFFRSISEKIFFGVEKKCWVQFRCRKLCSFHLWYFRRVLISLTLPNRTIKWKWTKSYYFFLLFAKYQPYRGPISETLCIAALCDQRPQLEIQWFSTKKKTQNSRKFPKCSNFFPRFLKPTLRFLKSSKIILLCA